MERRIIIEEVGKPQPAPAPPPEAKYDRQDQLLIAGIVLAEIAAYLISIVFALFLAALFCFAFVFLIEYARAKEAKIEAVKNRKPVGTV